MKRLPVPGTASPNQHCRCKHAVCPQSRRRTAAGPCCRQSCSCRSPQLLGVQGNPSQPLCQGHEHAVSHLLAEVLMVCIHRSWHSGKPNIYISLVHRGPSRSYFIPKENTKGVKKNKFFPMYSSTWWQDHGFSSQIWLKSPLLDLSLKWWDRCAVLFFLLLLG